MVYLDNGATSWPKPEQVYRAVDECLRSGGNPGRGVNQSSLEMSRIIFEARYELANFLNIPNEDRLIFTKNVTEAINMVLKGILETGDHVLISPMEHNSVVRPLEYLKENRGISYDLIPSDSQGRLNISEIESLITENTKLLVFTHASNVLGTVLPARQLVQIAKSHGLYTLIDGAQSAGNMEVDVKALKADFFAFTGHKGLLGPQGTGGLFVREGIELEPLIHGGTGSNSRSLKQDGMFPDDFESGTVNMPGIAGLKEGVKYSRDNLTDIISSKQHLMEKLMDYLLDKSEIDVYGPPSSSISERVGLVTFNLKNIAADKVGQILDSEYEIITRTGLHCSPLAHRTAGSIDFGGVRVSIGPFTREDEIDQLIQALDQIINQ
ncbi:aminotransferase class V-fold PLP-dependent enzyme [Natranaerobius thermophilus]|uniref:cysteine desulfurase n=1 Tax=Natranaerobius thermophilus (strain ATCC BAA-1301 / DSM 18059 / JW/NM-WN-LF) TaxID=457570 RepID=B2A2E4_NATTJ|nr:aminotransferase class V-fold PLP-dependent enzyme [Natranaerobius thermophilus]ACB86250.1 cysteine desulfurase family protein [Natranaerobius thermophilus JW/NM-WN-LF]